MTVHVARKLVCVSLVDAVVEGVDEVVEGGVVEDKQGLLVVMERRSARRALLWRNERIVR